MRAESVCMTGLGLDISLSGRGSHREPRRRESIPRGVLARCPTEHSPPNTQRVAEASSPGKPSHTAAAESRSYVPAAKSDTSCPNKGGTRGVHGPPGRARPAALRAWLVCVVSPALPWALSAARCVCGSGGEWWGAPRSRRALSLCPSLQSPFPVEPRAPSSSLGVLCAV